MPKDTLFAPAARSLVSGKQPVQGHVSLAPIPDLGAINVRLRSKAALKAAEQALGIGIPAAPNTHALKDDVRIVWLGPDEWMIQTSDRRTETVHCSLCEALEQHTGAATIVSDHSVALELSGPGARTVLEKGCPLDLHPRAFRAGHCAQSHFLQAVILLIQVDDSPRYVLRVRRSMAEYLWDALADAIVKEAP